MFLRSFCRLAILIVAVLPAIPAVAQFGKPQFSTLTGDTIPPFEHTSLLLLTPAVYHKFGMYGAAINFEHVVRPHLSLGISLGGRISGANRYYYRYSNSAAQNTGYYHAYRAEFIPMARYYLHTQAAIGPYLEGGVSGTLRGTRFDQHQLNYSNLMANPHLAVGYQLLFRNRWALDVGMRARFRSRYNANWLDDGTIRRDKQLTFAPVVRFGAKL